MKTFLLVGDTLLTGEGRVPRVDGTTSSAEPVEGFAEPERMKWIIMMNKIL